MLLHMPLLPALILEIEQNYFLYYKFVRIHPVKEFHCFLVPDH